MNFHILTLFPEMVENYFNFSILKRAVDAGVISVNTVNPRDYTLNKHKKVDDTPYGGGAGMVLMPQPYVDAYESIEKSENSITVMLSPQGEPLNDAIVNDLAKFEFIYNEEMFANYTPLFKSLTEAIQSNEFESENLAQIRDSLLPKLMSGELDVSDIEL